MDEAILPGEPPVAVMVRRSRTARRLSLRVSKLDGRVTLTLPPRVPEREARAFLADKEGWIRRHLGDAVVRCVPAIGGRLPVEGKEVVIAPGQGRAARLEGDTLLVPGGPDMLAPRVQAFLKLQARGRLKDASDRYAEILGVDYGKITLRDTRSRWGSCAHNGNLSYSWRLIMAPSHILDYVAAHEVAHRLEMNHSDRYWANLARVYPDYRAARNWLRAEGQALHAWRFDD